MTRPTAPMPTSSGRASTTTSRSVESFRFDEFLPFAALRPEHHGTPASDRHLDVNVTTGTDRLRPVERGQPSAVRLASRESIWSWSVNARSRRLSSIHGW